MSFVRTLTCDTSGSSTLALGGGLAAAAAGDKVTGADKATAAESGGAGAEHLAEIPSSTGTGFCNGGEASSAWEPESPMAEGNLNRGYGIPGMPFKPFPSPCGLPAAGIARRVNNLEGWGQGPNAWWKYWRWEGAGRDGRSAAAVASAFHN